MISSQLGYAAPQTLDEAVALLSSNTNAKVLAGGHTLLPMLKGESSTPQFLVDLRKISQLRSITHRDGKGGLHVGAMVTFAKLIDDKNIKDHYQALVDAALGIGDPQVRNRGTIAGNLASGDPAADMAAVALVLECEVNTTGRSGARTIPIADFFGDNGTTLKPDEIIVTIDLPAADSRTGTAYEKFKNRASNYAICGVAVKLSLASDGAVTSCRVAMIGATDHPTRLREVESALEGRQPTTAHIAEAARQASTGRAFRTDMAASAEYRSFLAALLCKRALTKAARAAGFH